MNIRNYTNQCLPKGNRRSKRKVTEEKEIVKKN